MKVGMRGLLICLMIVCQTPYAVEVERLYEAEVIASSEMEQDGIAAIKQALTIVLTRILAGNNILQDDIVKTVLAHAINYVDEYQYALIATNAKEKDSTRVMRVLFDEKLLVDVLRPGKLGFWNEIRPRTLVWLVVEEDGKQKFFNPGLMPDVDAAMDRASKQKSLPVLYPIQDLKEKRILSISDVLSAYSEHLLEVSLRYDVVSTLAGKMVKKDNCWKSEWTLYFDAKIEQWRSQCSSLNNVALNGFQGVYNKLSEYYAVKPDLKGIGSVTLKVSNIKDIKDLEKVTAYLDSLPMTKTVTWVSLDDGYNIYRVFYQGRKQVLNNTLAKGHVLRAEEYSKQNEGVVKYKLLME